LVVGHLERYETFRIKPTMNLRDLLTSFLLLISLTCIANADTNQPAATNGFTLTLRYGEERALSQEVVQPLYSKAVELLESSNFNSRAPRWEWNMSEILEVHRKTVSGKYLLVSFKEPRKIKTVGGEITVREIIIGLNRTDYASSLFTIDDEGRIVGHAKYSGPLCVGLLQFVKKICDET
jgi:hypothetical protein